MASVFRDVGGGLCSFLWKEILFLLQNLRDKCLRSGLGAFPVQGPRWPGFVLTCVPAQKPASPQEQRPASTGTGFGRLGEA